MVTSDYNQVLLLSSCVEPIKRVRINNGDWKIKLDDYSPVLELSHNIMIKNVHTSNFQINKQN